MAKKLEDRKDADFRKLCAYIETEIFNYSPNQKLQTEACLVLTGLSRGQHVANNAYDMYGCYPYKFLMFAFKLNKSKIMNAIHGKSFQSERSKMSYVCAIVRDNLNQAYQMYENMNKKKEEIEQMDMSIMEHKGAEYKSTNQEENTKLKNKFEELW